MPAAAAAALVVPAIGASSGRERTIWGNPKEIVVQREGFEGLDHVPAVQIDEHVAWRDQLREDMVREHL
jgi:hypothetical protein